MQWVRYMSNKYHAGILLTAPTKRFVHPELIPGFTKPSWNLWEKTTSATTSEERRESLRGHCMVLADRVAGITRLDGVSTITVRG